MDTRGIFLSCFVFFLGWEFQSSIASEELTDTQIVQDILDQPYYKAEVPNEDGKPVEVRVGFYINSLTVDSDNYKLGAVMYFRQNWRDYRLVHNSSRDLMVPRDLQDKIWKPDLFFRNEASLDKPAERLMKLNATGWIWYVERRRSTFSCYFRQQRFPFDTQTCPMMIESYGHKMDDYYILFLNEPVDIDAGVRLPSWTLAKFITYDCSQNYTQGAFPCQEVRLVLRRDVGFYLMVFYIPTTLLVLSAWATFWMSRKETTKFRGLLCVIFLLFALAELQLSIWSRLGPRFSYLTAFDLWMYVTTFFILSSFVEYIVVFFIIMNRNSNVSKGSADEMPQWARGVDRITRVVYMVLFILFLIIYAGVYSQ